jgi:hypothetical protein
MMKVLMGLAAAAAATMSMEATTPDAPPPSANEIAPARDGNIAIREELDAARRAGTVAAYDLFIARHPGHALEPVAREERARLRRPR